MAAEEWRSVPGYDGAYEVSTLGRVRSWKLYGNTHGGKAATSHLLKPIEMTAGYSAVIFSDKGTYHHHRIHRLVMEIFVGPCPEGMQVAHGDGNRANAALANLRYATPSENNMDKVAHGTTCRGERHHLARLTEPQVVEILDRLSAGEPRRRLANEYGISYQHIGKIARRDSWTYLTGVAS